MFFREYPKIPKTASFLTAMRSGMEIQTVCAIDLTGSNGANHEIGDDLNPVKHKNSTLHKFITTLILLNVDIPF